MIFKHSNYAAGQLQTREEWDSVTSTYTVFDGAGAQVSQRPLTPREVADVALAVTGATVDSNSGALRNKAAQALISNSTYLALGTPTAAQNAAQVKSLTRQMNALIRLELTELTDVSDT